MYRKMYVAVLSAVALGVATHANAAELFVPGSAATIQGAIDIASGGDTITVAPGTYGKIDFGNKNLRIRSTGGAAVTVIDAAGNGSAVIVSGNQQAANTILDGFTITGGTGGSGSRGFARGGGASGVGGGIQINSAGITVQNCRITGNIGTQGGGISAFAPIGSSFRNCEISDNIATGNGGAVYIAFGAVTFTNCTMAANIATSGGGAYVADDLSGVTLNNTILWDNSGGGVVLIDQNPGNFSEPTLAASYSNIQGTGGAPGPGNMDADPDFVSGSDRRLSAGSPCIDAGNSQLIDTFPRDLNGDPRGANDPATPDTGIGSLGIVVDLGAYEFPVVCSGGDPCPGDTNSDNVVNLADLLNVISNWGAICP